MSLRLPGRRRPADNPEPSGPRGGLIRAMTPDDVQRVGLVHTTVWREAYTDLVEPGYLDSPDAAYFADLWYRSLTQPPAPGVVQRVALEALPPEGPTEDGRPAPRRFGEIVGIGMAGPCRDEDAPTEWELWSINLLARSHGSGLADSLMDELVGGRPTTLWVFEGNARARSFYKRHGFHLEGARRHEPEVGATEIRLVRN